MDPNKLEMRLRIKNKCRLNSTENGGPEISGDIQRSEERGY
jgi:hypothetical protein